jgi:hypothetical protein
MPTSRPGVRAVSSGQCDSDEQERNRGQQINLICVPGLMNVKEPDPAEIGGYVRVRQ